MLTIIALGKFLFFFIYALVLAWSGMRSSPGFATWHMFAVAERCHLRIYLTTNSGDQIRVNPWDYIPCTSLAMDRQALDFFLFYLEHFQNLLVHGSATFWTEDGMKTYRIEESHVVDN